MRYLLLTLLTAGSAFGATTVVSDLFNGGSSGAANGLFVASWNQTGSWTNVAIGANLATNNGLSTSTGTAYLMNQIGPGTTAANEVTSPFSIVVTGNPGINVMTPLFSGLSLGPGTYYLVIAPNNGDFVLDWVLTGPPLQTLGPGVTQNPDQFAGSPAPFAPASSFSDTSFSRIFSVTGDAVTGTSAPEPSTIGVILLGAAVLAARSYRLSARTSR